MNISYSIEEISTIAEALLKQFSQSKIWLFQGEMGSGKTTLIKTICNELNVEDEMSSPTFSIINEYSSNVGPVYHFDLYRIEHVDELQNIGVEDYFYSGAYCFIEWPDRATEIIPDEHVEISIKLVDGKKRALTAKLNGPT